MRFNLRTNKTELIIIIVFFIIGFISLFTGVGIFISNIINNRIEITVNVVSTESFKDNTGKIDKHVYVEYQVDKKYISKLDSYFNSYAEGKKIVAYYEKNNPEKIHANKIDFLDIGICFCISFIFLGIGGVKVIFKKIENYRISKIKENGKVINATFVESIYNTSYLINGRSPFNIICEWYDFSTNKTCIFKSENIWINPNSIIEEKNIQTFPVYVNPNNINQYYVDLEQIENYLKSGSK